MAVDHAGYALRRFESCPAHNEEKTCKISLRKSETEKDCRYYFDFGRTIRSRDAANSRLLAGFYRNGISGPALFAVG